MLTTPRRITLYWLMLLISTLVVGGAAIHLLRREQLRLASQSAEAVEARRATMEARARLTVETIELLVGDAEAGLLDTLAAEPTEGLDAFLDQWEKNNPLVRVAFRSTADGRILRPGAWSQDEDGRGFLRRFSRQFGTPPPWVTTAFAPSVSTGEAQKRQELESEARKDITLNRNQAQSARRDVQELVKTPVYSNMFSSDERKNEADGLAAASPPSSARERSSAGAPPAGAAAAEPPPAAGKVAMQPRTKDALFDRRDWVTTSIDGRLHLAGWVQPGGAGEVRGVELELAALVSRLGGTLPVGVGSGEGYALRDHQGRVLHQVGTVPQGAMPSTLVPLATSLLPGWEVAGYLALPYETGVNGSGFFWVSALLVAIFVAAILGGGWLLAWQARRSEAEAAQKTSFVANVSHEFKTPLTTIRLYAELLEQGRVRDAAQGGDYLRTIGRETQRLARLVNNALDFSRLEQGKKKYARETLDLTAELARLLDTHAPRVAEAGLQLQRELPAEALPVTTDRDALEQIVLNLIDNACKYAAPAAGSGQARRGEVLVSVRRATEGKVEVRVADRGPGVPAEHRERIFEKFHRVDDALTAEKTGAGLGLSIARQLARGLGGELRYASRAGGGAEFILELP